MKFAAFLFASSALYAQSVGPRIPLSGTYSNRPTSPATGIVYIVTDDSSVGACAGGGSSLSQCRWSGSAWASLGGSGGGGGGTPGGSSGQVQYNNSGSFGGQGSIFSTGTLVQRAVECSHQSISSATVAGLGATTAGEITIQTSISGDIRWEQMKVSETTQFTGTFTALTISVGRPGGSNSEMTNGLVPLMQSSGDVNLWSTRPIPPQLTGTYTLVAGFVSTGANLSTASAGAVDIEICGYKGR